MQSPKFFPRDVFSVTARFGKERKGREGRTGLVLTPDRRRRRDGDIRVVTLMKGPIVARSEIPLKASQQDKSPFGQLTRGLLITPREEH
jgi:hypothetical protein